MRIFSVILLVFMLMGCALPQPEEPCSGSLVRYCKPHVYFAPFSADLDSKMRSNLDWAYRKLVQWPQKRALIVGYADAQENTNWSEGLRLAEARAISVKNYFVSRGIDPKRIAVKFKDATGQQCFDSMCFGVDRQVVIDVYNPKHWWIF